MIGPMSAAHPIASGTAASDAASTSSEAGAFDVRCATVVFRLVRGELRVGLPGAAGQRRIALVRPDPKSADDGVEAAGLASATVALPARDIVRRGHAGVRVVGGPAAGRLPILAVVSWAIARPLAPQAGLGQALETEESFVALDALDGVDPAVRSLVGCAFSAFLDATLADALTRRLLPRHVLFRKTDGFAGRSPLEAGLGVESSGEPEVPLFVGLLPDPFPLSALRELYERLLGAPLDRGNFRRQFQEIVAKGPVKALPIFERGVPHRAGQLFTFDRAAWSRFASK
ncbi:MAG: AraR C-terminal winged domain [Planctomycetota bacterium]|jgi:hypothetical protein